MTKQEIEEQEKETLRAIIRGIAPLTRPANDDLAERIWKTASPPKQWNMNSGDWFDWLKKEVFAVLTEEAPNDPKLSDSGPGAGEVSTAARGEGAGCAGASWQAAQPVTEPVGPKPTPLLGTDNTAVRCNARLGDSGRMEGDGK